MNSQVWIAISVCVLIAIVRKRLKLSASRYEILQVLSLIMFERTPLDRLLARTATDPNIATYTNQLILFE